MRALPGCMSVRLARRSISTSCILSNSLRTSSVSLTVQQGLDSLYKTGNADCFFLYKKFTSLLVFCLSDSKPLKINLQLAVLYMVPKRINKLFMQNLRGFMGLSSPMMINGTRLVVCFILLSTFRLLPIPNVPNVGDNRPGRPPNRYRFCQSPSVCRVPLVRFIALLGILES